MRDLRAGKSQLVSFGLDLLDAHALDEDVRAHVVAHGDHAPRDLVERVLGTHRIALHGSRAANYVGVGKLVGIVGGNRAGVNLVEVLCEHEQLDHGGGLHGLIAVDVEVAAAVQHAHAYGHVFAVAGNDILYSSLSRAHVGYDGRGYLKLGGLFLCSHTSGQRLSLGDGLGLLIHRRIPGVDYAHKKRRDGKRACCHRGVVLV